MSGDHVDAWMDLRTVRESDTKWNINNIEYITTIGNEK